MNAFSSRSRQRFKIFGFALVTAALQGFGLAAEVPSEVEVELSSLNGVYEDLDSNLEPIRQGSLTIRVSSPEHRLTVHGNRLQLSTRGDGTVDAAIEVNFEGHGQLIADVDGFGRFTDLVDAPRQTVLARGNVRLARAADGYLFTVVSADPTVQLEVKSGVAGQIVSACRAASMIPFVNLPCDGLETALGYVNVPMPPAGQQFLLPAAEMTAAEQAILDRFATTD